MEVAKNLVVFKESQKHGYYIWRRVLKKKEDGYYAIYIIHNSVEAKGDIMSCFQKNREMLGLIVQQSQIEAIRKYEDKIIRSHKLTFGEDDNTRHLSNKSIIYTYDAACVYDEKEEEISIYTPVAIKHCSNTDYEVIEKLKKEGKIVE